jgi:hypothetical protein
LHLRAHSDSADDHRAPHVPLAPQALEVLPDLYRELPRRRDDERARADLAREPVEDGEEEGGGLARPGRGGADDVAPLQRRRDRADLDGRRMLEPRAIQRLEGLRGEMQIGEGLQTGPYPPDRVCLRSFLMNVRVQRPCVLSWLMISATSRFFASSSRAAQALTSSASCAPSGVVGALGP